MRTSGDLPLGLVSGRRPIFHKQLGRFFEGLRTARGWTQSDAARYAEQRGLTGVSRQVILRLEKGATKNVEPNVLQSLAELYGTDYQRVVSEFLAARYVDLERRLWFVRPAKGDRGAIVYLNDDMLEAWRLFIAEDAWGPYNGRSFVRTLHRAGWPTDIRPYNLRHSVGVALSDRRADFADIAAHLGHSSVDVTRAHYVPTAIGRLRALSELLAGRLTGLAGSTSGSTTPPDTDRQKSKKARNSRKRSGGTSGGTDTAKRSKIA